MEFQKLSIKTTLINPQQIFSEGQIAAGLTPPLGIAYLASFLIADGYPVQIIDALGDGHSLLKTLRFWKRNIFNSKN
jgi:hypothetical protein